MLIRTNAVPRAPVGVEDSAEHRSSGVIKSIWGVSNCKLAPRVSPDAFVDEAEFRAWIDSRDDVESKRGNSQSSPGGEMVGWKRQESRWFLKSRGRRGQRDISVDLRRVVGYRRLSRSKEVDVMLGVV